MAAESLSQIVIRAQLSAYLQNSVDGGNLLPSVSGGVSYAPPTALTSGSGANQAQKWWQSTARALASGASETLNLYDFAGIDIGAGAGNDPDGIPLVVADVVGMLVVVEASSAGALLIGGDGTSAAWTSLLDGSATAQIGPIHPGGMFMAADPASGFPVVNTTNCNLKMTASGGAVTYDIYLLLK